jgi:hypothetical protein
VQPAPRSNAARAKEKSKETAQGLPVHSFRTLMADSGTLTKNRVRMEAETGSEFYELRPMNAIKPSPLTAKALCQFSDGPTSALAATIAAAIASL